MKERIQKLLAAAGVDSRRKVEEMVLQGRVEVNGTVVHDLPIMIDPAEDVVFVDGERVRLPRPRPARARRAPANGDANAGVDGTTEPARPPADRVYVLMHKPAGVFCTNVGQETNQGEQKLAIDLLPPGFQDRHRVYPVGRLDAESRGLLLLTNDGDLTNKLTHPRYGVPKTYRATVDGLVTQEIAEHLMAGVWIADPAKGGVKTARSFVKVARRGRDRSVVEITLKEGRNRQVRRTLAKLGHKVRDLLRVKLGPLELGTLNPGESRLLTPREVRDLHAAVAASVARAAERRSRPPKPAAPGDKSDRSAANASARAATATLRAIPKRSPPKPTPAVKASDRPDPARTAPAARPKRPATPSHPLDPRR